MAFKKKEVIAEVSYDMRGLFTIVKGQYRKTAPAVVFEDKETRFIGGYDPTREETEEWYQLMDTQNFLTVICCGSLEKVLNGLYNLIVKYDNDRQTYLSTHEVLIAYDDESGKKTRRSKTNPISTELNRKIYEHYGEYFEDMIKEVEDKAISDLAKKSTTTKKTIKKTKAEVPNSPKTDVKTVQPKKSPLKKKEALKTDVVEEEEFLLEDEETTPEPPKKKVIKKTTKTTEKVVVKKEKTASKGASLFKLV